MPGAFVAPAFAQQTTTEDIIKALTPVKTRSLSTSSSAAVEREESFINSVRTKQQALSPSERDKMTEVIVDKPSGDLLIAFGYNSDVIKGDSVQLADALGRALSSPDMKGSTFLIAGHTDAKGSNQSNLLLSERRAQAVKTYLVKHFALNPADLITVGYGKTRLKNKDQPEAAENRRVEVVNIMSKTAGR
ncbi:outer membrane protein OmpA-like peptidoglycan-associated protein [Rhodoblastus acidophilus]|uniref:OmpA family protein n=1 Tax=Rhodoblastus acidophilus TaxID=1074 RepID=UPI002224A382|nr:OmpA family protein [Rhodoblastus acidophilus]MCW2285949.1 outer membrane protein OmpA-like peptidoglycan-associated protein [Rhodoblastus acidophilus]MCW2334843.1 outer membrane protein OmpA-like peptidoglycan-associated protein [Rhodoblastus acidophilus]